MKADEAYIGEHWHDVAVYRYRPEIEAVLRKYCPEAPKAEPWLHWGVQMHIDKPAWAVWIWDTRQVIASGRISYNQGMTIVRKCIAIGAQNCIDNGSKVKGSGDAVDIINEQLHD